MIFFLIFFYFFFIILLIFFFIFEINFNALTLSENLDKWDKLNLIVIIL